MNEIDILELPLHLLVLKTNRNVYRVDFYSQFWQFTHVEALNHPIFRPWMKLEIHELRVVFGAITPLLSKNIQPWFAPMALLQKYGAMWGPWICDFNLFLGLPGVSFEF